jgi:hypothetical protein
MEAIDLIGRHTGLRPIRTSNSEKSNKGFHDTAEKLALSRHDPAHK